MEKPNKRKADLERTRQIILSVASELFKGVQKYLHS